MSRVLLAIVWAPVLAAQEQPGVLIRTETRLVLLRCHVVRQNRYVTDLKAEDFELREDGAPRKIALFESAASRASGEALPVEVYLAIDVSHSVVNPNLLDPVLLKGAFLEGLGERASLAVYAFGGRTRRFTAPTSDPAKLAAALSAAYDFAHPGTRLYGSIIQVAREAASSAAPSSRIMVVLSDGMDTTKIRRKAAVEAAMAAGIPVYPILLGHERVARLAQGAPRTPGRGGGSGMENPRWLERQARAATRELEMQEFAGMGEATGGAAFDPPFLNSAVLKAILEGLVGQIRSQYVLGFYPPAGKATRHNLRVRLRGKGAGKLCGGSRTLIY